MSSRTQSNARSDSLKAEDVATWHSDYFTSDNDTTIVLLGSDDIRGKSSVSGSGDLNGPGDFSLPECAPKPRPTPIYRERPASGDWASIMENAHLLQDHSQPPSRCPSLMSGGTLSSRNSSTRSTRSSVWGSIGHRNSSTIDTSPIPEDASFPSRTPHFKGQLAEMCPVKTCDRHRRGFTKAGDRERHVFTHCTRILTCGFCESNTSESTPDHFTHSGWQAEAFVPGSNRVNLFLDHLITYHGAREGRFLETTPKHPVYGVPIDVKHWRINDPISTCCICREPFTAQVMFEHLPGCILRDITTKAEFTARRQRETNVDEPTEPEDDLKFTAHLQVSQPEGKKDMLVISQDQSICTSRAPANSNFGDISELTASSRCLSLTSSKAVESSEEETDWSEDVTSRESSPGVSQLPRRLSPAKRRVVDTIMQEFQRLFSQSLRSHTAGGSSSNSSSGGTGDWSSNTSTYSNASFVSRKRSLSGGGSTPPNDDDGANKRRRPDSKPKGKQPMSDLRFACPYYKRNPGRHQIFTSCRDPGFITVARLKEHLYRRHLLPPQCHRCCTTFADDIALREHQRDPRGCEVRVQVPLEGFDKDQERRLKSKKRSQVYQSEEEKWKGVYRILFPDDGEENMPAPYIEYQPSGEATELSNTIRFQEFSRLELPRLVRHTLETVVEQETQPLEDKLKERLVDIVKQCQTELETMFQATSGSSVSPVAFNHFDSLPDRTTTTSIPSTEQPHRIPSPDDGTLPITAFTSLPDSSHDLMWPPSTQLPDLSNSETDVSLPYVDLDGYPTPFEEGSVIQASTGDDPLTWPFIAPFPDLSMSTVVWGISVDGLQGNFT